MTQGLPSQPDITLSELVEDYKRIGDVLNQKWPIPSHEQRVFARMMKMMEELGELSDEILTSMNLQRSSKVARFSQTNLADEFADVFGSLLLLGIELELDLDTLIKRKIHFTLDRLEKEVDPTPDADTTGHQ